MEILPGKGLYCSGNIPTYMAGKPGNPVIESEQDIINIFERRPALGKVVLTTTEIREELIDDLGIDEDGLSRQAVYERLKRLNQDGKVVKKEAGRGVVWHLPGDAQKLAAPVGGGGAPPPEPDEEPTPETSGFLPGLRDAVSRYAAFGGGYVPVFALLVAVAYTVWFSLERASVVVERHIPDSHRVVVAAVVFGLGFVALAFGLWTAAALAGLPTPTEAPEIWGMGAVVYLGLLVHAHWRWSERAVGLHDSS